jgi:parallel beta-helix repeat protein
MVTLTKGAKYVDFVNITFSGGSVSGVTVEGSSGPILFQNCAFTNNRGNGLRILDSDIKIMGCRFSENDSNGIFLQNSQAVVQNALVVNNRKSGIFFAGFGIAPDSMTLSGSTISDNDSDGVVQQGLYSYVTIDKSLITFNKGIGIHREVQITVNAPLFLSASDLYLNAQQNLLSLAPYDSLPFRSEDPLYVNKATYNYSIGPASTVPDSLGYKGQ